MRTVLFGGTDLTLEIAQRIRESGETLAGVVHVGASFAISYQPGGVKSARYADVRSWCLDAEVPECSWTNVADAAKFARGVGAEFAVAAGWYHMLPGSLRQVFSKGTAGIHASLLPKLRGGAPLNWALLLGETETGITMFELGDGVDDGPIYGQRTIPIASRTTIADLVDAVRTEAGALIAEALPAIASGNLTPRPQVGTPSYSLQRNPDDGRIDWRQSAQTIDRLIRAVSKPYPGAFTTFGGELVRIWSAEPLSDSPPVFGAPGQLFRLPDESDPLVVTGDGPLVLRDVASEAGESLMAQLRRSGQQRFGN